MSNLNEIFSKYGCNTLEAKVPVVNNHVATKLKDASYEQQTIGTLELKNESALNAVEGRVARTRDRPLQLVEVGKDIMIAAGKQRERSPVEKKELDNDLEEYMRETARIREQKAKAKEERNSHTFSVTDINRHMV